MQVLIGIVAFLFMLSVIVILHELGHFLVARHFNVYCHEFSIGMGPLLYQKQGKETAFSIRAIPFGGYVMMAGEEDGSQDEDLEWLTAVPNERRLNFKPAYQQILVMLAGICVNVLLAWVIFVGVAMARGYVVEDAKPVIYQLTENSVVADAGLQVDDEIIKIKADGESITPSTNYDVSEFVQYHHDEVTLTVQRDKETFDVTVTPKYDKETSTYLLGYQAIAYAKEIPWYQCIGVGSNNFVEAGTAIFKSLNMLIHGQGLDQLSGPVGIYKVTKQTTEYGWGSYFSLFAMISLNIGIFNAIPIPALDGGRVLIVLIEKLFRRKISTKVIENIIMASFILLMALVVYATYNDILRLL